MRLPAEIDLTSRERAYDQLHAAFASGVAVVIADLSATTFCDCAAVRHLMTMSRRAAAQHAELRLVIPPGSPVLRLVQLMGLDLRVPVYPSAGAAARGTVVWLRPRRQGQCSQQVTEPAGCSPAAAG